LSGLCIVRRYDLLLTFLKGEFPTPRACFRQAG
jgi:hypothetical protein